MSICASGQGFTVLHVYIQYSLSYNHNILYSNSTNLHVHQLLLALYLL